MNRRIRLATKDDFLYACVVLAMFVATAVGLFGDLAKHGYGDSQSTPQQIFRIGRNLLGTTAEHLGQALAGGVFVYRPGVRENAAPQLDRCQTAIADRVPGVGSCRLNGAIEFPIGSPTAQRWPHKGSENG